MPGIYLIPLKYVCKEHSTSYPTPNHDLEDYYLEIAPLKGGSFVIKSAKLYMFIMNFISINDITEVNIKSLEGKINGRVDFLDLQYH